MDKKQEIDEPIDLIEERQPRARGWLYYLLYAFKLVTLFAILVVLFAFVLGRPSNSKISSHKIIVKIDNGQSSSEIATTLQNKNVISSKYHFLYYYFLHKKPLLAGTYQFTTRESVESAYTKLVKGQTYTVNITIPEGWRREQIAQYLNKEGLVNYEAFMQASDGKEGKLFPDTYSFPKDKISATNLVATMVGNFNKKTKGLNLTSAELTIASIVEREARNDEDRAPIAGVLLNRLNIGMKLQDDPSVQYGVDNQKLEDITASQINDFKFWQPLQSGATRTSNTLFNTYLNSGLPPNPIDNPGLKSILAAIHPTPSDNLYFVSDKDGAIHFAKTLTGHNENIQKFVRN